MNKYLLLRRLFCSLFVPPRPSAALCKPLFFSFSGFPEFVFGYAAGGARPDTPGILAFASGPRFCQAFGPHIPSSFCCPRGTKRE